MKAIIPIHIAALRVSANDAHKITTQFKGRMARFDTLPYTGESRGSSTGDALLQPLESNDSTQVSLQEGIHLHWELPDYFKKGVQTETGNIQFPQAPNRWLITRYLCKYDASRKQWLSPTHHSWVVESDYISVSQPRDKDGFIRVSVPVPLPVHIAPDEQPFRYMGRVVEGAEWALSLPGDQYLKDFTDAEGNPYYLHALGFLGPAFSSYYPDCCSVFGFHDRFADETEICEAIRQNKPVQFKVSYQVMGWIEGVDPCDGLGEKIRCSYEQYVDNCHLRGETIAKTPLDFFAEYALENWGWQFQTSSLSYELDTRQHLKTVELPEKTLCNGIVQEIVWDMIIYPGARNFLGNPDGNMGLSVWEDPSIRLSVGNTSVEALAALLSADIATEQMDSVLQNQYEYLLNMLQSGRIEEVDRGSNLLSRLEKGLHADSFASEQGGLGWAMQKKAENTQKAAKDLPLPLPLYRCLEALNKAQKEYDTDREALEIERKQFFMDWYRYIKMYVDGGQNYPVTLTELSFFLESSFEHILHRGEEAGRLSYAGKEENGVIYSVQRPEGSPSSKAYGVWRCFEKCREELEFHPEWELLAIPASVYWLPTDPVLTIEVDSLRCRLRNGDIGVLPVRVSTEVQDRLEFSYGKFRGVVEAREISGIPVVEDRFPANWDMQQLAAEAWLLIPSLSGGVVTALKNKGGAGNPAMEDEESFRSSLMDVLGGGSSIGASGFNSGLFRAIREEAYKPAPNPTRKTTVLPGLTVTFTNSRHRGWVMCFLGWSVQEHMPDLDENRHDPFLPLAITWEAKLEPVKRDEGRQNYSRENITGHFSFNTEGTDYTYAAGAPFSEGYSITYTGFSLLMKKTIQSLAGSIEKQAAFMADDQSREDAQLKVKGLKERKIISLTLSGFSANALQRNPVPSMPLVNLTREMDVLTNQYIREGLLEAEEQGDTWYAAGFNQEAPVSVGPLAQTGFCPLRSGFLSMNALEVVDVFGQRMLLSTPERNADNSFQLLPSAFLLPVPGDEQHAGKAYLPPRLLMPSRLHFQWLDAQPLTTPVCGWVLPNHLDNSLFFYDSNGSAVGAFGIEHHVLRYRSKAGNRENPSDSLTVDIGTPQHPLVNPWLAHFMWYVKRKSGETGHFLRDLMQAILDSEEFVSPEKNPDDGSLAVFTGRPLVIARVALGMETYGASCPLNQLGMNRQDPWPTDVESERFAYAERMKYGDAGLPYIDIPVRLGDRYDMDDGLIGYLRETADPHDPYALGDFYAPAAGAGHGVVHPADTNLLLRLNAPRQTLTLLVDPHAGVHALTGLLPVASLEFPSRNFAEEVGRLQMTFFTNPLMQQKLKFSIQLPEQKGYAWSWVSQHQPEEIALDATSSPEDISWGYSPQTLEEGWLRLSPESKSPV